jgi:hypothetical protein
LLRNPKFQAGMSLKALNELCNYDPSAQLLSGNSEYEVIGA